MLSGHYYENRWFVLVVQAITIFLLVLSQVDLILKVMLVFGYFMLFRQKRWHKHLLIMLLMSMVFCFASGGFTFNI